MRARSWIAGLLACVSLLGGCGAGELPGDYWSVDLSGEANSCTGDGADYAEKLEYRVLFDGNDITLAIGEDVWATGRADGCQLLYQSIVWEDEVEGKTVRWQIIGEARVDVGGGEGCVSDGDWDGVEQFVVLASENEKVSPGCTYDIKTSGKYLREVIE